MKYKWICYGCGRTTSEGYHILYEGTVYHYCAECLEDAEAVRRNEGIQAVEKF